MLARLFSEGNNDEVDDDSGVVATRSRIAEYLLRDLVMRRGLSSKNKHRILIIWPSRVKTQTGQIKITHRG